MLKSPTRGSDFGTEDQEWFYRSEIPKNDNEREHDGDCNMHHNDEQSIIQLGNEMVDTVVRAENNASEQDDCEVARQNNSHDAAAAVAAAAAAAAAEHNERKPISDHWHSTLSTLEPQRTAAEDTHVINYPDSLFHHEEQQQQHPSPSPWLEASDTWNMYVRMLEKFMEAA